LSEHVLKVHKSKNERKIDLETNLTTKEITESKKTK